MAQLYSFQFSGEVPPQLLYQTADFLSRSSSTDGQVCLIQQEHQYLLSLAERVNRAERPNRGKGACKRFNQTLLSLLGSLGQDEQMGWPVQLPMLLQAYKNTEHGSTGLTPFFLMSGRHVGLPVDVTSGGGGQDAADGP